MKKTILLILTLVSFTVFLFSCSGPGSSGDNNQDDSSFLWASGSELYALFSSDVDAEVRDKLLTSVSVYADGAPVSIAEGEGPYAHEIVVGRSSREVSKKAYRLLEREISENSNTSGYIIYAYNGSVALAYSDEYVIDDAVDCFITHFSDDTAEIKNGIVVKDTAPTLTYIAKQREKNREERFEALELQLGEGAVNELRVIYSTLYGEDLYMWLANLWDPVNGGFYYSNSARDNVGFLPDIESTAQALSFMDQSGLLEEYGDSYASAISGKMRESLLSFAMSLQSPKDGFFYHPQWGTNIGTSRRGRDLDWSTSIITNLGGTPLYDAPNGVKGSLGAPGVSPTKVTGRLSVGTVQAVSKVKPTASTSSYLKSIEAFKAFLDGLPLDTYSYSAGNTLNAIRREIQAAGDNYVKFLVDYLYEKQNPQNGLWEETVSYESVNGLFKIGSTISALGYKINYTSAAMNSAMQMAMTPELYPETDVHVCSIYNMWEVMGFLISSASKYEGATMAGHYRNMVRENAEELIRITKEKMLVFKKNDGGFSYFENNTNTYSQGAVVAVKDAVESDVNATCILGTGTVRGIFDALGVEHVPMYYAEDGRYFLETIDSLGAIIKDELTSNVPTERVATFTDGAFDTLYLNSYFGQGSTEVSISQYEHYLKRGTDMINEFAIVEDPEDKDNQVLKVVCEASKAHVGASTQAKISNEAPNGNCYIFEAKFYYTDILGPGDITQLHLISDEGKDAVVASFRLMLNADKKSIGIKCYNDGKDGTKTFNDIGLSIAEWFTLRIEFFATGDADTQMARILVGTDGNKPVNVGEVTAYRENTLGWTPSLMNIAHQRTNGSTTYLDDISFSQIYKDFKSEPIYDPSAQFKPAPNVPSDFENGYINSGNLLSYKDSNDNYDRIKYGVASHEGTEVIYSVTNDPTGAANKVLKVTTTNQRQNQAGYSEIAVTGDTGACYVFETKLYVEDPTTAAWYPAYYHFRDTDGNKILDLRLYASEGTASLHALKAVTSDSAGEMLASFSTECWIKLKIEFYKSNDGDYVKVYCAKADKTYALASVTPAVSADTSKPISAVRIQHQRLIATSVYYDDMFFSLVDKAYSPESDYPEEIRVSDFEDGNINDDKIVNNIGSQTTVTNVPDPSGADNKVIKITNTATQSGSNSNSQIKVQTAAKGNCYVYESRMYVPISEGDTPAAFMYFYDTSGTLAYYLDYAYDAAAGDILIRVCKTPSGKDVFTEIGRFAAGEWVNIRIELYKSAVAEDNCVKLYLGESQDEMKYVGGMTNCLRTSESANDNPLSYVRQDYFRKTNFTFYLDDVLFSRVDKKYTGETIVADFEDGNANGNGITTNCGSQTTATNETDPTDADNKVLKVTNTKVDGGSNSNSVISLQTVEKGNCYVYESRMYVTGTPAAFLYFYDTANTIAFYIQYSYDANTEELVIQVCTSPSGSDKFTEIGRFAAGEWVNVRIELYKSDVAEENCVKLYLGDSQDEMEYVGGMTNCPRAPGNVNANPISHLQLDYFRKFDYTFYLDDVLFSRVDKEYTGETIVADFEDGNANGNGITSNLNSWTTAENVADPTGADNKVLKVTNEATSEQGNSNSTIILQTVEKGNCYVYESRIYVPKDEAYTAYIYFYDTTGTIAFALVYAYDVATESVLVQVQTDSGYTTIGSFALDKWINVRIELYKSAVAEENCVKLYCGESQDALEYVGGMTNCPRYSANVNDNPLSYILHEHFRKSSYTVYFDDVLFSRVDKEYTAEN